MELLTLFFFFSRICYITLFYFALYLIVVVCRLFCRCRRRRRRWNRNRVCCPQVGCRFICLHSLSFSLAFVLLSPHSNDCHCSYYLLNLSFVVSSVCVFVSMCICHLACTFYLLLVCTCSEFVCHFGLSLCVGCHCICVCVCVCLFLNLYGSVCVCVGALILCDICALMIRHGCYVVVGIGRWVGRGGYQ